MGKRKRRKTRVRMSVEAVLRQFFPLDPHMNMSALKLFDIMEFSTAMEERFVRLLAAMLVMVKEYAGEDGMSVQQAVAEVAYRLGVSVATVKRYLQKHAVSIGPFKVQGRRVFLREWVWDAVREELRGVVGDVPVASEDVEGMVRQVLMLLDTALGGAQRTRGDDSPDSLSGYI